MVAVPGATAVTRPPALTVATPAALVLYVAVAVTLLVEASLMLAVTVIWDVPATDRAMVLGAARMLDTVGAGGVELLPPLQPTVRTSAPVARRRPSDSSTPRVRLVVMMLSFVKGPVLNRRE